MHVIPPDYEKRMAEFARRCTDDIAECDAAQITVQVIGPVPFLRFVFDDPRLMSNPLFKISLVAESRKDPLSPGKLLFESDATRRIIRESVEYYFKLGGLELTRKVADHACV